MTLVNNLQFFLLLMYSMFFTSDTYRILVIAPLNSKSHTNVLESVAKALALKGHKVDVISHFELENPPKNFTTIINLNGTMPKLVNNWTMERADAFRNADVVSLLVREYGTNYCELMSSKKMQSFIRNPPKDPPYDLFITEALAANCYFGYAHILNVPLVIVSALTEVSWFDEILGNTMSTAYAVNVVRKHAEIKTFWDRMKNHILSHYDNYRFFKYTEKDQTEVMRKYLSPGISSIREIEKKTALLLVNAHHSVFGIRPLSPAIVQIAGIQIEQSKMKLTPELKNWIDESTHGIVLFTLGSLIMTEDLSKEILLGFYASFAKLSPIRVIMKIVNERNLPPGLPKNVRTMPWIPQIPVLRHKNTKVFITHGGINSVQEALYFGVPMIGIPLFGDQEVNIRLLAQKNMVYEMHYRKISERTLDEALSAVLYDPKYREAARRESHLFRDRPMNATDTAVFWAEYVIRNGANSLRSPAMDMPWWKAELLDVYGFLLSCILLMSYIVFLILRKITYLLCGILKPNSRKHVKKD